MMETLRKVLTLVSLTESLQLMQGLRLLFVLPKLNSEPQCTREHFLKATGYNVGRSLYQGLD